MNTGFQQRGRGDARKERTGRSSARLCENLCTAIRTNLRAARGFWTAVAERGGDTAFRLRTEFPKRCRVRLATAVQKGLVAAPTRCVFALDFGF